MDYTGELVAVNRKTCRAARPGTAYCFVMQRGLPISIGASEMRRGFIGLVLSLGLGGCASLIGDGSRQDIAVTTSPVGASCVFWRNGENIGTIASTPGTLTVKRRKYDIDIKCDKPGYAQASYHNHSGLSSMVAGNIAADLVLTAGISSIVDSANGADNEYNGQVTIVLAPITASSR